MAVGKHIKDFVQRGIRSCHVPTAPLIIAGSLLGAATALYSHGAKSGPTAPPSALVQKTEALTASALLRDQSALLKLIQFESDRAATIKYKDSRGNPATYVVPDLDRAIINHVTMVQEKRDPVSDKAADALFGIDDGMFAWMMRRHATEAGLAGAMEGISVNDDGSIDATSASKLTAMLDLKNDPAVATRIFAIWLASEIMEFDGNMGRPPSVGEIAVIGLTDAGGGISAASTARDFGETKLGPLVLFETGSWKRPFFVDRNGWMSAKDAMANFERNATKKFMDSYGRIPVRLTETPTLDEDFTAKELRNDPNRFVRIVVDAVKSMPDSSRPLLDRISAIAGLDQHDQEARIAGELVAMTATVDELRGQDVSGGIYAMSPGQWLRAAKLYGDPAFVDSFTGGIDQKADGSIRVKSADQFGAFMRLRDHGPIATQIVLGRMLTQTATLQRDLGRVPSNGEIAISHLFGVAAAEQFAHSAESHGAVDLRFAPDDPRGNWAKNAFDKLGNGARAVKKALDSIASERAHAIDEHLERHANPGATMRL
ncbi:hypothetical protein ACVIGB_000743 [Bradyrhizobium sp. USDA 4341]